MMSPNEDLRKKSEAPFSSLDFCDEQPKVKIADFI
jgi:hypothetical protein